jgi:hypothetical protein
MNSDTETEKRMQALVKLRGIEDYKVICDNPPEVLIKPVPSIEPIKLDRFSALHKLHEMQTKSYEDTLNDLADTPPSLVDDIACEVMNLPWVRALAKNNSEEEHDAMCDRHGDIQNVVSEILKKRGINDA